MARAQKLKVFRTAAGFNDAYVAAPSQKAALAAWGSDKDLFARGIAEVVTDPALTAEPLASPGVVVKHSRGTTAQQIKAMPDPEPRKQQADGSYGSKASQKLAKPKTATSSRPVPKPRPSSTKLDAAETALEKVKTDYGAKFKALEDREANLVRERRDLENQKSDDTGNAETAVDDERRAYDTALQRWRKSKTEGW